MNAQTSINRSQQGLRGPFMKCSEATTFYRVSITVGTGFCVRDIDCLLLQRICNSNIR
jgi:hypothetical protein